MSLREVLGAIRRPGKTRLDCPRCGEPVTRSRMPLDLDGLAQLPSLRAWMSVVLPTRYTCTKCGYTGFLAMEQAPEEDSPDT